MAKTRFQGFICKGFEVPGARLEQNRDQNEIKPDLQGLACKREVLVGGFDLRKTEGPFCKSGGVDRQEILLTRVRLIWAVGFRSGGQDWIRWFGAALDAGSSRLRRRAAVSSPDLARNSRPGTVSCAASPGRKRRRRGTWLRGLRGATTWRRASSAATAS